MSINAITDRFGEKLNIHTGSIENTGTIKSTGFYDTSSYVAQVTAPDDPFKDYLTGWANLTDGTLRTQLAYAGIGTNNRAILPDAVANIVDISGEFSTEVVGAVGPWQFSAPTFYNPSLNAQTFVLSDCIAIDSALDEYRALPITFPGVDELIGFAWTNLGALAGQTITVKYRYTLCQEVP